MLSFATPLWLLGLSLVPAIRWLHCGGPNLRSVPVSSLLPWKQATRRDRAAGERRPPDPAWRRRALITTLLSIALAGPQSTAPLTRVTLWVDDSLSMLTREQQGTRLEIGLAQARAALATMPGVQVEVRPLGDPWQDFRSLGPAVIAAIVESAGRREPGPPPVALLRRDSHQWLLTDGADATLGRWPAGFQADRVFQVGTQTRNVGLDLLSARRDLKDPRRLTVQLRITNGGHAIEMREVTVATELGAVSTSRHQLPPRASTLVTVDVPEASRVITSLQPTDALASDDRLTLDLAPLRQHGVTADRACPQAVLDALRVYPAVRLVQSGADVVVDCGALPGPHRVPTIRFPAEEMPVELQEEATWSSDIPEESRVRIGTGDWRTRGQLSTLEPGDRLLLAAGSVPLIVVRGGAIPLVETSLDFGAPRVRRLPETPLLVRSLLDVALGRPTLDPIAMIERGEAAVRVAPVTQLAARAHLGEPGATALRGWALPFLLAALLALLWEIAALVRQWLALRHHARIVGA